MKYQETIGIVGGMGSYATLDLFRRLLEAFPAEKEWDRPRIIIDNRCTMPSRVRAILYQEERPMLVSELAASAQGLLDCGADILLFACNTSHVFLDEVLDIVPQAKPKTIHLIETLAVQMAAKHITQAHLVATEGTMDSKIYQQIFNKHGIELLAPSRAAYAEIREYIESVKQNSFDNSLAVQFYQFCDGISSENIILGCTELPVLTAGYSGCKTLWDPLDAVITKIKETIR